MVAAMASDIDLSLAVEDHFVVRLLVSSRPPPSAPAWVERRPRMFDAAQLTDPVKAAHFADVLASAPAFPWQLDVHSHAHGLTSFIVGALASSFPLALKVVAKKREFLSASTLLLVRAKRDFRRLASRARSLTLRHPLVASVATLLRQLHSLTAVGFNRALKAALKVDRTSFACEQASSIAGPCLVLVLGQPQLLCGLLRHLAPGPREYCHFLKMHQALLQPILSRLGGYGKPISHNLTWVAVSLCVSMPCP